MKTLNDRTDGIFRGAGYLVNTALFVWIGFAACGRYSAWRASDQVAERPVNYKTSSVSYDKGRVNVDTNFILGNISKPWLMKALGAEQLSESDSPEALPRFIRSFLDSISPGGCFDIAAPGGEWLAGALPPLELREVKKSGCAEGPQGTVLQLLPKKVPSRQLVYFGAGRSVALLAYNTSGRAGRHIAIIRFKGDKVLDYWFCNRTEEVLTKGQIIGYLNGRRQKMTVVGGC